MVTGVEHPMVITMELAPSARDARTMYTKVNSILYVCPLRYLLDGILLEPPCMYRFERSFTHIKECKHKGTPRPFAREA